MSEGWVETQERTFTSWVNHILARHDVEPVSDLSSGFASGANLVHLVRILTLKNDVPLHENLLNDRFEALDNVDVALHELENHGIKLVNIGAPDIVDGNVKLILGLIWCCIIRFQVLKAGANDEAADALVADNLLGWVNSLLSERSVSNLTSDFQDGSVLFDLVLNLVKQKGDTNVVNSMEHFRSCEEQLSLLPSQIALDYVRYALTVSSDVFQAPKLMTEQDIIDRPDHHSMVTYLSCLRQRVGDNVPAVPAATEETIPLAEVQPPAQEFETLNLNDISLESAEMNHVKETNDTLDDHMGMSSMPPIYADILSEYHQTIRDETIPLDSSEDISRYNLPPVPSKERLQQEQRKLPPPPFDLVNNNGTSNASSISIHGQKYLTSKTVEGDYFYTAKVMLHHYTKALKEALGEMTQPTKPYNPQDSFDPEP